MSTPQPPPRRDRRWFLRGAVTASATAALAAVSPGAAHATPASRTWRTSWATAQVAATEADQPAWAGLVDTTIRHILRLSAGGQPRIRLANPFGAAPIVVGPVTVARRAAGAPIPSAAVDPASVTPVTFGGARQALLAAGASLTSDPIDVDAAAGEDLVVSVYVPGPTGPLSFHRGAHATGYLSVPGDHTADADPAAFPTTKTSFFLISGVDVRGGSDPVPPIAVLGDSITEGVGTPDNTNERWPDLLAQRLARGPHLPAVANLGISGNRVLLDDARFGRSGQARFDRDVLALPGLRTVIVYLGINDVQQPPQQPDAALVVAGYRQLVLRGRDHGLRVVGCTIAPFEGWTRYTPEIDAVRRRINDLVRTGDVFDAVVDFDAALRDPDHPSRLRPEYNSGDGLHPNAAGAAALAAAAAVDPRILP